jgi:pyridoxamine 5'-phosphate oxidase
MSIIDSLFDLRRDYLNGQFDDSTADDNPFRQFELWFEQATASGLIEPNAMTVATSTLSGKPSIRVVLIKKVDKNGFVFFTNYDSRKGQEIQENPQASLLFYWDNLERQVRIEGKIEKVSLEESEEYFKSRPYESRLGAWASKQSTVLKSRFSLMRSVVKLMAKYPGDVPLPPFWGGYRLVPDYFEFWQGRKSRLHDRITYSKQNNKWIKQRLYP